MSQFRLGMIYYTEHRQVTGRGWAPVKNFGYTKRHRYPQDIRNGLRFWPSALSVHLLQIWHWAATPPCHVLQKPSDSILLVATSCSIFPYPLQAVALALIKYQYSTFLFNWTSQFPRISSTHLFIQLLGRLESIKILSTMRELSRLGFPGGCI